jgi:hypothetical protein
MVKFLLVNALIFLTFLSVAQIDNKDVVITSSGSGTSQELAIQTALRNAIEQAFGTFISSQTEILNDEIVADQMSSVASGNIKSYEVLNESQLPNGSWASTLRVIVSVDKLTSFVEAKGITVEIKGGLFALNIKQQLLNEQGEIMAISQMFRVLHEVMQTAFDFTIKSGDPKSLDEESKNWEIPLTVTATTNKNMDFSTNYFLKTLSAISLTQTEVDTYKSLNKQVFQITVQYLGKTESFYLRKKLSFDLIDSFINNWKFYTQLFQVHLSSNEIILDEKIHDGQNTIREIYEYSYHQINIELPNSNQEVGSFLWNDKRSLSEIEQMTGYTVKPKGVISQIKQGGYVVYEISQPTYRIGLQMKSDKSNEVSYVIPNSIAEKANLKPGDKIISVNNIAVKNGNIKELINENKLYELKIERSDQILTTHIIPKLVKGFGLIVSPTDLGEFFSWEDAIKTCNGFSLYGYDDWYLPSKDELTYINEYVNKIELGNLAIGANYWSNSSVEEYSAWFYTFYIRTGRALDVTHDSLKGSKHKVRAVRIFEY